MNVTPKASVLDVAGVIGLLSFLADKDACASRLDELTAAADKATKAENDAITAQTDALAHQQQALEKQAAAQKFQEETIAAKLVVAAQQTELEERLGKVGEGEKINNETAAALTSLEVRLKARESDLDVRDKALRDAEIEVAELKKEYEAKLDKLRAITTTA